MADKTENSAPQGVLRLFIAGIPSPGGSKRFVGFMKAKAGSGKARGRALLVDMGGEKTKNWRSVVAAEGRRFMTGVEPLSGALKVRMQFVTKRPKAHLNSKGTALKPWAPYWNISQPDVLKMARSTEDALTGICWVDDALTADLNCTKRYAGVGEPTGVLITIQPLLNPQEEPA